MLKVIVCGEIIPVLSLALRGAVKSIEVAMYEWGWYQGQHSGLVQDINRVVCTKAKAGIPVSVVLHTEAKGRPLYAINRKTESALKLYGATVRWGWPGTPVHAKVWIIDRRVVIAGSHNISVRAARLNHEVSVMFDDADEVARTVKWFSDLWAISR
jgi:phosphatidylserine/phosphatidylglycerophosphate/cardiolipin synthase-like enzyme